MALAVKFRTSCLFWHFMGSSSPELLVLTGDNAHGDSEHGAPYAKLQATLNDCVPPAVPIEIIPGNHDRRKHLASLASDGAMTERRTRLPGCPEVLPPQCLDFQWKMLVLALISSISIENSEFCGKISG